MKAIVYDQYGPPDVLRLEEVDRPEPEADQVRIQVRVASINAPDWRLMLATPFLARVHSGLLRPKFRTLGCDIAGTVEAAGSGAKQFRVGDEVFGDLARYGYGGFAEYVCAQSEWSDQSRRAASYPLPRASDRGDRATKAAVRGTKGGVECASGLRAEDALVGTQDMPLVEQWVLLE